jgi:hypothetical protein
MDARRAPLWDELIRRRLVGGRDGQAPRGSNDLVLGPLVAEVVQTTPERGQLPLDLAGE